MNKKNINIKEGQYLGDILPFLPSNTIIRKNITGIGATTLEINCSRHSIIVLPNLPVIYQKSAKHKNVLGVYGDTTILQIINYLSNTSNKYKKILVTPESFGKLQEAFINQGIAYKNEYFLLIDECDKLAKDYNYRPSIIYPLYFFFDFKNKALISATALVPRDPRFIKQNFEFMNIIPDYDMTKNIEFIRTNNFSYVLNYILRTHLPNRRNFIFCNSINMITHIIKSKGIEDESSIFCSESGKEKLLKAGFKHVGDKMDETKISTHNFLTSRFFSALDINYDKDVNIIIISDPTIEDYTMIDPETDTIQIIGRFRNRKRVKTITIVASEDTNLNTISDESCQAIIEAQRATYETIQNFANTLASEESKALLIELGGLLDYNMLLNKDGTINYFALDNYTNNNRVKSYYKNLQNLVEAYKTLKINDTNNFFFNITKYHDMEVDTPSFSIDLMVVKGKKFRTIVNEIIDTLDALKQKNIYDITPYDEIKADYKRIHPDIIDGYDLLDHDTLRLVYNKIELKKELLKFINSNTPSNFPFLKDLQIEFVLGDKIESEEIIDRFKECIDKHNLKMKPTLKNLQKYIILKRSKLKNNKWGYFVKGYNNISN